MSPTDAPDEGYGLVMPFVVCSSQGGPYDDGAFVAGWVAGRLDAQLQALSGQHAVLRLYADPRVVPQLDLIAMQHERPFSAEPWDEHPDEWVLVTIGQDPEEGDE